MVDPATCTLYELYDANDNSGAPTAGSGAIWNLRSDALRPADWTSADAAGLPILPGLVNYDQAATGSLNHAIRFTAVCTQEAYIWPARHQAGQANPACPPMGARFRLKAGFSLPPAVCSPMCQTVLYTMKNYGLILADNGSNWYFQGTADTRWTDTDVGQLKQIPASAFEAVDESSLMVNPGSGQAVQLVSTPPPPAPAVPPTPTTVTSPPSPLPPPSTPPAATTTSAPVVSRLSPGDRPPGPASRTTGRAGAGGNAAFLGSTRAGGAAARGLGPLSWLALSLGTLAAAVALPFAVTAVDRRRRRRGHTAPDTGDGWL